MSPLRPLLRPSFAVLAALAASLGCTPTLVLPGVPSDVPTDTPTDAAVPPSDVAAMDASDVSPPPDVVVPSDVVAPPDVVDAPAPRDVPADMGCAAGTTLCGAACVNVSTELAHCGGCGRACAPANATGACVSGACRVARCNDGAVDCDGEPANGCEALTASDARNCGGCGIVCGGAATCVMGACVCAGATCGGRCVNLASDPSNCGACGYACPAGVTCASGRCGAMACAPGLSICGAQCVNTEDDARNCGACGSVCGAGRVCVRGRCGDTPWLRTYGAGGDDAALAVVRDATGNVYVGGSFVSGITLGDSRYTGSNRGWIAKFSPTGAVLWSMLAGASVRGLSLDAAGNVYGVGAFNGSTTVGTRMLGAAGGYDWYAASWTSEGTVRWAVRQGGGGDEFARRVAVDATGRVWVAGTFTGISTFDGRSVTSRGGNDVFLAQLRGTDGGAINLTDFGSTAYDRVGGLVTEASDGAALSVGFGTQLSVGSTTIPGTAVAGAVLRFGADLALRWHATLLGASNLNVTDLARDGEGNLYVSGECAVGPIRVGASSFGEGYFNGFVASLTPAGSLRWGILAQDSTSGPAGQEEVEALSYSADGMIHALGWVSAPDLTVGALSIPGATGRVSWYATITPEGTVTRGRVLTSGLNVRDQDFAVGPDELVYVGGAIGPGLLEGAMVPMTSNTDVFVSRTPR